MFGEKALVTKNKYLNGNGIPFPKVAKEIGIEDRMEIVSEPKDPFSWLHSDQGSGFRNSPVNEKYQLYIPYEEY